MTKNPSNGRIKMEDIVGEETEVKKERKAPLQEKPKSAPKQRKRERRIKLIAAVLFFFALSVMASALFSSVIIKIVPQEKTLETDISYKAGLKNKTLNSQKFVFREKIEETENTSATREIKEKASGELIIYNAFSSEPQSLVQNTRFETPEGKIYRIDKKIIVPGAKITQGKIEPSSIIARVYADKPGEEYNIGLTQFTIPGFKDTPKYGGFYAKSKTEISGGFSGTAKIVSEEDADKLRNVILDSLKKNLENKLSRNLPAGFIVIPETKKITVIKETIEPKIGKPAGEFRMEIEAEMQNFAVLKKELENLLASSYLGEEFKEKTTVAELDKLSFKAQNINFENGEFDLAAKGKARFVWKINQDKIKEDLINRGDKKIEEVFKSHPEIKEAVIVFRPSFWRIFPKNPNKIIIEGVIK